jgi:serpin B
MLGKLAKLPQREIELYLPKFRVEPPTLQLSSALKSLGMKTAFDVPQRSANFDRMALRKPDDYLYIGEVFHKTYLVLDEQGTEAAAATAVAMLRALAAPVEKPVTVRVDHPFLFAIQHTPSGTCLFLGRVTDPR